eukprot:SAG11_NODE_16450_length_547_cov_0.665179_1_plen_41_part_10
MHQCISVGHSMHQFDLGLVRRSISHDQHTPSLSLTPPPPPP